MSKITDEKREAVKREIIDAFFSFRSNRPQEGYAQENRNTNELWDDLHDMYNFTNEEIANYMMENDYVPTTEQDGSVKWAIWRMISE